MKLDLFTKPNCAPCNQTKAWLDDNNIKYTLKSIMEQPRLDTLLFRGLQGVPVVSINDFEVHWQGYRPDLLEEHLS